jgi:EAL domain-containing protein (putative c-di-GMP-specific phosphodiesterase class I)
MIWRKAGAPPLRLALNVSAKRLQDKDYIPQLLSVLAETGFPAADLELEIQENTPIRDWDHRLAVLRELSNHGVRIAVDDFGSGYCSIRYLKKFPVQTLKIDGAFIQNLTENPQNSAIASSMISLASALGISVVAEKVETPEQLATLRRLNCDNVQGFLLGQPLPADEFLQILFK